jgi:hypothetical protein
MLAAVRRFDDHGWQGAPVPAVLVAADGVVRALNDRARQLFPSAEAGAELGVATTTWLAEAHRSRRSLDGHEASAGGWVCDRSYVAHPVRHEDGAVTWWLTDDTELRRAREALWRERERVEFLLEMSTALQGSLTVPRCMETIARLAADRLADAVLILAPPVLRRHRRVSCVRGGTPVHGELAADPSTVPGLSEALHGFPTVPSHRLDPGAAPDWLLPDRFGPAGSIVVTPLPGHGVAAGVLVLLRGAGSPAFSEDEEAFARLFAARAGAAMSAARLLAQQVSISEILMRDLLPPVLREVGGVEFAGGYRAAHDTELVGGDFYDLHEMGRGESLAVLGDVCGKGLEAAALTGKIRNTLHALLPMADDHRRMLDVLNTTLRSPHSTRFVTLVLVSAVRDGAGVRLRVTSAGHLPPLVVHTDGRVEEAPTRGTLIGVLPEISATTAELVLAPGETCLLYTDGVTEARGGPLGGVMFGEDRLRTELAECGGMPAEAVVERVAMLATQWCGHEPRDDIALLAIRAPRGDGQAV